jgi:dolichyl-diphosphooligosaccharide--protein glycosyltransferase/undecaprenyl-diphosphooligosaccharide--protein glycosyltransferase
VKQNKFSLNQVTTGQMLGLMLLAYIFSFAIRMIWVYQFQDNPNFLWNGELMINTNDGYFFASGAQQELYGLHQPNPRVFGMWDYGVIFFTTLFVKITPFSLETVTLYMPAVISSLVVIPIILISRLYKQILWGFLAALLGSIAWSYYNRTMIGYYDTDMFSAMAPMFILFFLMKSTIDFNLKSALYAAISIAIYPFLYDAGLSIVYAMGIMYTLYMIFYHRNENTTYLSLILVFVALLPFPLVAPFEYIVKVLVLIGLYFVLRKTTLEQKIWMIIAGMLFLAFLFFGNVFSLIFAKVSNYVLTGTKTEGLRFYGVAQTVREAGQIPFSTFANRISGSQVGVLIAFIGYVVLIIRHRAFILALPLMGIGVFALFGGLRFTVYAVPMAAMGAIYLFFVLGDFFKDKKLKYAFIIFATAGMIYPNITHIIGYKVPTVLNKTEVQDLVKLDEISDPKDYTLTWWDYGYPIWYYSDTSTLIDGGKHNNDNFIISKIMQTSSPELAANLSRLAVETYVDSNYSIVANTLFAKGKKDQIDPNLLLEELANSSYDLPKKTRDIYLYLPYRMMRIFPTVAVFGNLDLLTGKSMRKMSFYPTSVMGNSNGVITLRNGIVFDAKKGEVAIGKAKKLVKYFIVTQNTTAGKTNLQSQLYHADGEYAIVYMKSYGQFIVMDIETFNSAYVQMFMLEKYDKNLFELVVSSAYSKIYKLKK